MAYEVTATRKRPQTLMELIDQEFVVATLKSSIEQGRIAHAYLFSGPRGIGKTSAARILAKSLNCDQGPTAQPCGECSTCLEISKGNALDVIEIDGASNTSVNDVREIKDEVLFAPNTCRYKVYIIDEVHMLSNSAFNALLKTIEEPPPYIVFIFATTEIHKVPATIRSRCQQFNFKLISITRIKEKLSEVAAEIGITAEDSALFWIAKEATGSMRDAYTLFDQVVSFSGQQITLVKMKEKLGIVGIDELNRIIELVAGRNSGEALVYTNTIMAQGIAVEQFVIELTEYFRNILFLKLGIRQDHLLGYPAETFSSKVIDTYSRGQLETAVELLLELYRNLRFSVNQKFELELVISRLCYLQDMVSRQEILLKIKELKKQLQAAGTAAVEPVQTLTNQTTSGAAEDSQANLPEERIAPDPGQQAEPAVTNQAAITEPDIPQNLLQELIQQLHKQKKLTLASSLEKISSWSVEGNEFVLNFYSKDKFSAELIKREKKKILEIIAAIIKSPLGLKIHFLAADEQGDDNRDERVEILKEIFNGEIIKGD